MNTESALFVLARIEELTDSAKSNAQEQGKNSFWQRDKVFISDVKQCLLTNNRERIQWVYNQMRNLSQGFGTYCTDLSQLDHLLDDFHDELERLLLTK